jgi:hypothetical protein
LLGFIGQQVGANWEEWRDRLHYLDYVVIVGLIGLGIYALIRWRRGSEPGEADEGAPTADARGEAEPVTEA